MGSKKSYSNGEEKFRDCEELHDAAAANNLTRVTELINRKNIDINYKNGSNYTPLHAAAEHNSDESHFEVIKILLENGADVSVQDRAGRKPLYYLVENCNVRTLELYLKFEPNIHDVVSNSGRSLLFPAIKNSPKNLAVVQRLIDLGMNVNSGGLETIDLLQSPLQYAVLLNVDEDCYEVFEILLKNGADVNAKGNFNRTPFFCMLCSGNIRTVQLFLKYKPDIHTEDVFGQSTLFSAVENHQNPDVLQLLIDLGLYVDHCSKNQGYILTGPGKQTPLNWACKFLKFDNTKIIKCLLKNGTNINFANEEGVTPLIQVVCRINRIQGNLKQKFFEEKKGILNFMAEQTDFNVTHNNVHILNCDVNNYDDLMPDFMWQWILEHIAKLQFLNVLVHPSIYESISNRTKYRNYFKKCKEELVQAKNTKLKNCWVAYFNLLVDNRRKLRNYAGNEDLIQDFKNINCVEKFPIYGAVIQRNVEKGLRRRELFDESTVLLSGLLPIFNPTHLIVRDILNNFMSKKDLLKLKGKKL